MGFDGKNEREKGGENDASTFEVRIEYHSSQYLRYISRGASRRKCPWYVGRLGLPGRGFPSRGLGMGANPIKLYQCSSRAPAPDTTVVDASENFQKTRINTKRTLRGNGVPTMWVKNKREKKKKWHPSFSRGK